MEFLRRLAASATQAQLPGSARAALPTRFGARSPAAQDGMEEASLHPASTPRVPSGDAHVDVRPKVALAQGADSQASYLQPSYLQGDQRAIAPLSVAAAHSSSIKPHATETRAAQTALDQNVPQVMERLARVERRLDAKRAALPRDDEDANPESANFAIEQANAPPSADNPRQGPLSQAALNSRVPPQDERTIVHVTIDRIDVRAPSSQGQPPAARPARKAPSPDGLATYLRGTRSSGGTP